MKKFLVWIPVLLLPLGSQAQSVPDPQSEAVAADLPLPNWRKSAVIREEERNPFGRFQIKAPKQDLGVIQGETEESKLRALIGRMPVQGTTVEGTSVESVVLGTMILSVGDRLPTLLPGQFERVVLQELTQDQMIFGFLENDGTTVLRTFSVKYNLTPRVRYALPSDVQDAGGGTQPFPLRGVKIEDGNEGF